MATAHTAITRRTNTEVAHTGIPAAAGDAPAITTTIGNDRALDDGSYLDPDYRFPGKAGNAALLAQTPERNQTFGKKWGHPFVGSYH
jgi:hypothetical protein